MFTVEHARAGRPERILLITEYNTPKPPAKPEWYRFEIRTNPDDPNRTTGIHSWHAGEADLETVMATIREAVERAYAHGDDLKISVEGLPF